MIFYPPKKCEKTLKQWNIKSHEWTRSTVKPGANLTHASEALSGESENKYPKTIHW